MFSRTLVLYTRWWLSFKRYDIIAYSGNPCNFQQVSGERTGQGSRIRVLGLTTFSCVARDGFRTILGNILSWGLFLSWRVRCSLCVHQVSVCSYYRGLNAPSLRMIVAFVLVTSLCILEVYLSFRHSLLSSYFEFFQHAYYIVLVLNFHTSETSYIQM